MMMHEQVYAQALLLAGELDSRQQAMLQVLCVAAAEALQRRLRDDVEVEVCRETFLTAASLFALADLRSAGENGLVEEFKAGDLTVKHAGGAVTAASLQQRAEKLMKPYLKDHFSFLGV